MIGLSDSALEDLKKMLKNDEGYRAAAYKDTTGRWTIGCGRNIESNPFSTDEIIFLFNDCMTEDENKLIINDLKFFDYLLDQDIENAALNLQNNLKKIYTNLSEPRRCVLIAMAFNLGFFGLFKFAKMFSCIKSRDYEGAAREIFNSNARKQTGERYKKYCKIMVLDKFV